jgi:8-amino-7-oxononanoate synthase
MTMSDFTDRLTDKLSGLDQLGLKRTLPGPTRNHGRLIEVDGETYLNVSSNDYLGLSTDEDVMSYAREVLGEHGVGATGSRLICGDHPLYRTLESELADWKDRSSALVFGSGYLTNVGVVRAVTTGRDLVVYDELAHRCLIEGARLSEADVDSFHHNDPSDLDRVLAERGGDYDAVLVLVEGLYSMDGDLAPLEEIVEVTRSHDGWVLVDEAHSAGVMGKNGAGLSPELEDSVEMAMGTLSKAFGGYGGYVAGEDALKPYLVNRATSFIYSTGLPPSVVAGNLAALRVIRSDDRRRDRLDQHLKRVEKWLDNHGIPHPNPMTQVIPLMTGNVEDTVEAGRLLSEEGVYGVPIRYPTVPRQLGRVRISLRADFQESDIEWLTDAMETLNDDGLLARRNPWHRE